MLPCLVIGDSIALGVGQTLPECHTEARVGVTSRQFVREFSSPQQADRVVISLGINDGVSPQTIPNLERLREKVRGRAVYWLLPAHHDYARTAIVTVAARFGDWLDRLCADDRSRWDPSDRRGISQAGRTDPHDRAPDRLTPLSPPPRTRQTGRRQQGNADVGLRHDPGATRQGRVRRGAAR